MRLSRLSWVGRTACIWGNLDACWNWGYAPEYVEGMWRMLQYDTPADYVIATGTSGSVRDFVLLAFDRFGLDWESSVNYDARYLRPTEVDSLIGDASEATTELGWKAQVHVPELVHIMVDAEYAKHQPRSDGASRSTACFHDV